MTDDIERADAFSEQRTTMAPFMGLLLIFAHNGVFFSWDWNAVSPWQLAIWVAFAIVMLALLFTGGGWFQPARVRELANDEITKSVRAAAINAGFLTAMFVTLLVVVVSPYEPIEAQRAAHMIFSFSVGSSFLYAGIRERFTHG